MMKNRKFYIIIAYFLMLSFASCMASEQEIILPLSESKVEGLYKLPVKTKTNKGETKFPISDVKLTTNDVLTFDFVVERNEATLTESRSCVADAGFIIGGCTFIIQNNKKDVRLFVGYGSVEELPYYILNRFAENETFHGSIKRETSDFVWAVKSDIQTVGDKVSIENKKEDIKFIYTPVEGKYLLYFVGHPLISQQEFVSYSQAELHPLFKYEKTAVSKYDWAEPAAKHLLLKKTKGKLQEKEVEGLKNYLLEYELPTHNHMNYYFRKRMNSYMMEWVYQKTYDNALLDKAIAVADRAIEYRNDNFGKYKISYSRTVAPLWPNFKEAEVYEDGAIGLVPGASTFAGLASITVPVRMIANNPALWKQLKDGVTYYDLALQLIDEALKTIDYTYEVFVGDDNMIRYPETLLRTEWHDKVYIYNRVFPLISGAIPLVEALEQFELMPEKVTQIDAVNQAMINYLKNDMTYYGSEGTPYLRYPYSQAAQDKDPNKEQVEDFMHGSFDSRDFQLFYLSGRYDFDEEILNAMANTVVDIVADGDGKFNERMNGSAKMKKFKTPIAYDGFIWYATYRPEVYPLIIDHIINEGIAYQNGVWDVLCLYEILKLKDLGVR